MRWAQQMRDQIQSKGPFAPGLWIDRIQRSAARRRLNVVGLACAEDRTQRRTFTRDGVELATTPGLINGLGATPCDKNRERQRSEKGQAAEVGRDRGAAGDRQLMLHWRREHDAAERRRDHLRISDPRTVCPSSVEVENNNGSSTPLVWPAQEAQASPAPRPQELRRPPPVGRRQRFQLVCPSRARQPITRKSYADLVSLIDVYDFN